MKIRSLNIIKQLLFQIIFVLFMFGTFTHAATIFSPSSLPLLEIEGGIFGNYFDNIKGNCTFGEVLSGFDDNMNKICKEVVIIKDCSVLNGGGEKRYYNSGWGVCEVTWCSLDYYKTGTSICSSVGNGYYSNSTSIDREQCTNHPDSPSRHYIYTSDGNGTNNCSADSYTPLCGVDLYESSNGVCSTVGTGYYSPSANNTRYSCSTSPVDNTSRNYSYTSDGNGSNSCSYTYSAKCGVDYYESSNGVCSAVGTGYYSTSANNTRYSCTNKTANSYYTSDGNGINSCSWTCSSGYNFNGSTCTYKYCSLNNNILNCDLIQ